MPGGRKLPEPLVLAFLMAAPGPRPRSFIVPTLTRAPWLGI